MTDKKYNYLVHIEGASRPMTFLSFEDAMLAVEAAMPYRVKVSKVER